MLSLFFYVVVVVLVFGVAVVAVVVIGQLKSCYLSLCLLFF